MAKFRSSSEGARKAALTTGAFLGVILVFWLLMRVSGFARFYERIEAGVVRVGTGVGNSVSRVTKPEQSLATQFLACQESTRALAINSSSYESLQREVQELRALVDYANRTEAAGIVTHVVARAVDDDATRVLIDRGTLDGLQQGSAAVIDDGVLFGMVEEVRGTTAIVRLVANAQSNIPAAVLGKQRTIGLVEGREGALLVMEFIPQDAELGNGNLVVTSGLDGLVREGLVIGLVTEVVSVESAPFQQAFIELLYEPREWTTLLVLPPPGL
ncbi:MAG: rod shape-determining protein MreC [Patescibacteria group bacterium]